MSGLKLTDLTLLDNGQPEKILSFQTFDAITATPDSLVEVILVIDTLNLRHDLIPLAKSEAESISVPE